MTIPWVNGQLEASVLSDLHSLSQRVQFRFDETFSAQFPSKIIQAVCKGNS